MKSAFLDTSALAAILFDEPGASELLRVLSGLEALYASNLLEAEIRSAAAREGMDSGVVDAALLKVKWVHLDRTLSRELKHMVSAGLILRGADLWHLACALYLASDPAALPFITLDHAQAQAAVQLGFKVLPENWEAAGSAREARADYGGNPPPKKRVKRKAKA